MEPDKKILTEQPFKVEAIFHNNTKKTITLFYPSTTVYGIKPAIWTLKGDATDKTIKHSREFDQREPFKARHFKKVPPGETYKIGEKGFTAYQPGKYNLTLSVIQDGANTNLNYSPNKEVLKMAREVDKFSIDATISFQVEAGAQNKVTEEVETNEISWEELETKKNYSIKDALKNPSDVYRLSFSPSIEDKDYTNEVNNIAKLKNVQSLNIHLGKNDFVIPDSWFDMNLMRIQISGSQGGKLIIPDNFTSQGNLREVRSSNPRMDWKLVGVGRFIFEECKWNTKFV